MRDEILVSGIDNHDGQLRGRRGFAHEREEGGYRADSSVEGLRGVLELLIHKGAPGLNLRDCGFEQLEGVLASRCLTRCMTSVR